MYSKILNLNYKDNRKYDNQIDSNYLNWVGRSSFTIKELKWVSDSPAAGYPYKAVTGSASLTNYPLSNVYSSFSLAKEAKMNIISYTLTSPSITNYASGITIDPNPSAVSPGGLNTFNCFALVFNKFNRNFIDGIMNDNYGTYLDSQKLTILFRSKGIGAVPSISVSIKIRKYDTSTNYTYRVRNLNTNAFTDFSNAFFDFENGMMLFGRKELYNILGTETPNVDYYDISVYFSRSSNAIPNFCISNVFVGNSIDFYADENLSYKEVNLSKTSINSRTGTTFIQKNSTLKQLELEFGNLTSTELMDNLKNYYDLNRDLPMLVFPFYNYNGTNSYDSDDLRWSKLNYKIGGMYYVSDDFELKNSTYDVFNYVLKLKEYK